MQDFKKIQYWIFQDENFHSWISLVGPKANDKSSQKKQKRRHRESHMKTETEIGVVQPQAKECLEPPEAGRSSGGFALRSFRGGITCGHLGFALLASTTERKYISVTLSHQVAAAAAKLLQSCPTLCDPIDGSPTGSCVPGILQARTLEWVAISFSNA